MARPNVLTADVRKIIERLWAQGWSQAQIARAVGVARSTISREFKRYHSAQHGVKNPLLHRLPRGPRRAPYRHGYRADGAQARAERARRRPKRAKLARPGPLRELVLAGLGMRWSPRQISAWLADTLADQPQLQVSHETIYEAIYVQSRGNLRVELAGQPALRSGRAGRKPQSRQARAGRAARRPWIGELLVSNRPAEAADRAVPGHWEGDLLIGASGSSAIVTLVERSTRFALLGALPEGRDSSAVIEVISRLAQRLPEQLWRSLTWDQGSEMAQHAAFTVATGCPVYFCDPHSPWQRGSNENTNGLLRQYFPKGSFDFRSIDQDGLDEVAQQLNTRPRMTLGWRTPAQRLNELLAQTR